MWKPLIELNVFRAGQSPRPADSRWGAGARIVTKFTIDVAGVGQQPAGAVLTRLGAHGVVSTPIAPKRQGPPVTELPPPARWRPWPGRRRRQAADAARPHRRAGDARGRGRRAARHAGRGRERFRRRAALPHVDAVAPHAKPRPRPARLPAADRGARARRPAQSSAPDPRRGDRTARGRPRAKLRYLQRNPKASLYADFADFAFFRPPDRGRAFQRRLRPRRAAHAGRCSRSRARAKRRWRKPRSGSSPRSMRWAGRRSRASRDITRRARLWRAIGLDAEGLDLAAGARAARAQFSRPRTIRTAGGRGSRNCSQRANQALNGPIRCGQNARTTPDRGVRSGGGPR